MSDALSVNKNSITKAARNYERLWNKAEIISITNSFIRRKCMKIVDFSRKNSYPKKGISSYSCPSCVFETCDGDGLAETLRAEPVRLSGGVMEGDCTVGEGALLLAVEGALMLLATC